MLKELLNSLLSKSNQAIELNSDSPFENNLIEYLNLEIGIMPKEIVLFDYLTPVDHLELYCRIKGDTPQVEQRLKQ